MAIFIISAVLIAACFIFAAISILGNIAETRQRALLEKIYRRANPSGFDDAGETRLDEDLLNELDDLLHGDSGKK
jgi:hypothetical protein